VFKAKAERTWPRRSNERQIQISARQNEDGTVPHHGRLDRGCSPQAVVGEFDRYRACFSGGRAASRHQSGKTQAERDILRERAIYSQDAGEMLEVKKVENCAAVAV
jgi:hypothetical protein